MKKIIALLLALIMTFSAASVAFATEGDAIEPETTVAAPAEGEEVDIMGSIEDFLGEYSWILDLPFGVVPPALKLAKIALKFVKVYLKICGVFNLDPMETAKGIFEYIAKIAEENEDLKNLLDQVEVPTTAVPETV